MRVHLLFACEPAFVRHPSMHGCFVAGKRVTYLNKSTCPAAALDVGFISACYGAKMPRSNLVSKGSVPEIKAVVRRC
jgi:hypothetical protein